MVAEQNMLFMFQYLHPPTISLDEPIYTDEVHTPMNGTLSRDVTRKNAIDDWPT